MKSAVVFFLFAALTYSFTTPGPVAATFIHKYSVAYETTGSGYTGLSLIRTTRAVTGQVATGCSFPYSGEPVYQTSWVMLNNSDPSWKEIGIGHQCNDTFRYYFWGYGLNGAWFPLGEQLGITNGQSHSFKIASNVLGAAIWDRWYIDSTVKAELQFQVVDGTGTEVRVGLETYAGGAQVLPYDNISMKYQKNAGGFSNWAGQDTSLVQSPLCGDWGGATSWSPGQGLGVCN